MARRPKTNSEMKSEDNNSSSEQKNNFQDEAEKREYDKGKRAGSQNKSRRNAVGGEYVITTHANGANDIEMHSLSDQLLEPLGKLSQHLINGRPIYQTLPNALTQGSLKSQKLGGIMRMGYAMTVGDAVDSKDGINLGSNSLFNFVRSKTGGTSYYEAPDLGLYNICATSLYVVYAVAARLYGTIANEQTKNLYTAEAMVTAMGFNYDDFAENILDFRGWLNLFAEKVGTTCIVPKGLQYFRRQTWLASNIYMDSEMEQSQYYLFIPMTLFKWNEGVSATQRQFELKRNRATNNPSLNATAVATPWTTGTGLLSPTTSNKDAYCTFSDLKQFAEDLYDAMRGSQDAGYIAAGYLRAFENNIMMLSPIDETYRVDPVYNSDVLMQIENSFVTTKLANFAASVTEDVSINKGYLVTNYYGLLTPGATFNSASEVAKYSDLVDPKAYRPDSTILNFHNDENVTPAKVMEASRMLGPSLERTTSFADGSLPTGSINGNKESAGGTDKWYAFNDVASEIFIDRDLFFYEPVNSQQPWRGIMLRTYTLPTYMLLYNTSQRIQGDMNAILAAEGSAQQALVQAFIASQSLKTFALYELHDTLQMLAQWDWHPRVMLVNVSFGSGNDVVVDDYDISSEGLDFNVAAVLSDSQLKELNRYDIYSQFVCREIGEYLPKF